MNPAFRHWPLCGILLASLAAPPTALAAEFSADEKAIIASLGPWPPPPSADSSNRLSQNPIAVRLGEALFFDHALGGDSKLSCASCHDPGRAFSDGRKVGVGRELSQRNTPSLFNLAGNRWFGWGGEADSLWAQSIRPLLSPAEMASSAASIAAVVRNSDRYRRAYRELFATDPDAVADELLLVQVAKALAAYQETLVSPRTPFDAFRDGLLAGDSAAMAAYPESAQRGLRTFIGEGRCTACHFGAGFSNREFGDIGIPFFVDGGVDPGRYRGIQQVRRNRYNRLGEFNDGDAAVNAIGTVSLRLRHRNFGEFKVPGLRSVAETAPYMHNGSLADLPSVVLHYSKLDPERLHADGEKILRPLHLSAGGIDDLVAFLRSLGP